MMTESTGKKTKLGSAGLRIVLPMVPVGAQVSAGHVQFVFEGGAYASSSLMGCVLPSQVKAASAALKKVPPSVPSCSGGSRLYVPLVVKARDGAAGQSMMAADLLIGDTGVVLSTIMIDPSAELVSSDESIQSQIEDGDDPDDGEDGDDDDPDPDE